MPKRLMAKGVLLLVLALPLVFGGVLGASAAGNTTHHPNPRVACVLPAPSCW